MEYVIGIRTDDFVVLVSDKNVFAYGALNVSEERNKIIKVGDQVFMACTGTDADVDDFGKWAQANLRLYKTRHGYELSPRSVHYWIRKNIADNLRSEDAWQVNVLVGGYDKIQKKAYLGSVDYLGNSVPNQNYLFQGLSGRFAYTILDSTYKKDMSQDEALELVRKCIGQSKKRVIANYSKFTGLIVDKDGVHMLDDLSP